MTAEKLREGLERANRLAALWQARAKELERRMKEQENMEIVQAVRSIAATPEELKDILGRIKNMKEIPLNVSEGDSGKGNLSHEDSIWDSEADEMDKEDVREDEEKLHI